MLLMLAGVVVTVGSGYYAYDHLYASKFVSTDNAYTAAEIAQVTPAVGGIRTQAVATVKTDADGTFSLRVRPPVQTQYTASSGDAKSNVVGVRVRPLVRLKHIGPNRFLVRALAARSLVGKWASLQRWSSHRHAWVGVKLVFFRSATEGTSPTMTSRAVFRTRLAVRIRVVVPRLAARPGYIAGFSNSVRG